MSEKKQFVFGAGVLYSTPLFDSDGNEITTPSPVQFGTLQEGSVEISYDTKALYGNKIYPEAVARTKGSISGKAKAARVNGLIFNTLIFGGSLEDGIISVSRSIGGQTIPDVTYQITAAAPDSGTWAGDLGVRNAVGNPMERVASSPATGQYSVANGVYTFASADKGKKVYIDFQYTATSATAVKSTVKNELMGTAPTFRIDLYCPFNGQSMLLTLHACTSKKLSLATKNDDFMIPEFEFEGFADDNDNVLSWSTSQK